jgi:ribosome-binding factor A
MVQHREQVASTLQRAVQSVLTRGLNDPRIKGLITVTAVKVSPDYAQATVLVSIHPEDRTDVTMQGLTAAARHVRSAASRFMQIRRMPELTFRVDQSLKKQAEILAMLDQIERERIAGERAAGGDPDVHDNDNGKGVNW